MLPETWFRVALSVAVLRSNCLRSHVGACVVSAEGVLLSVGYNRSPDPAACPRDALSRAELPSGAVFRGVGACTAVHAEVDALSRAGSWEHRRGASVYVTREPCADCWTALIAQPLHAVYWPGGSHTFEENPWSAATSASASSTSDGTSATAWVA